MAKYFNPCSSPSSSSPSTSSSTTCMMCGGMVGKAKTIVSCGEEYGYYGCGCGVSWVEIEGDGFDVSYMK